MSRLEIVTQMVVGETLAVNWIDEWSQVKAIIPNPPDPNIG
jgi:hypothetical protein